MSETAEQDRPGVGGLTLEWDGFYSAKTKLLDKDGRNLLEVLRVQRLQFDANPGERDSGDAELTLKVHLKPCQGEQPFRARHVRMLVPIDDLRWLAAAHGYELTPIPQSDAAAAGNS